MSSIELLKIQQLDRLKAALKSNGDGFSLGLKRAFTVGDTSTCLIGNITEPSDEATDDCLNPIINNIRPTLRPRPRRLRKKIQQTTEIMSQMSQTVEACQPDTAAILEKIDPLLTQLHQQTSHHDSQQTPSMEERTKLFQELLDLSLDEINVACQNMKMDDWKEDTLADLCDSFEFMENLGHAVACTVIQSCLYPYIVKQKTSLPRILMNSLLKLGKSHGNALLNGLVFPLLGSTDHNNPPIDRFQMELISKLASVSLNVSSRMTFLRFLISKSQDNNGTATTGIQSFTPPSDLVLQLLNTLTSVSPLVSLDPTTLRQLIQMIQQVVQARPKDKACMQILLTLTSKHTQSLVDAKGLDDLEKVASQSDMFLKRSVVAQVASIRKKVQETG